MHALRSYLRQHHLALVALFVALGGTTYAASHINGASLKNRSVAGVKIKTDTLGGKEIKEARLGKVPRAGNADTLGRRAASDFALGTQLTAGLSAANERLDQQKAAATSTEYGFGQVLTSTGGPPISEAGSFIVTPDIPDNEQQAQTTQQFVAQHNGVLVVLYGVRGTETDGTGASNPAALCKVIVTNKAGLTQTTAANPALGGLPFQPVNNKSAPTSTDPTNANYPFALKQSGADADQTNTFSSTVAVAAGDTYTVGMSCVDLSVDATDPSS
jgi:hypothetical protein